MNRKTRLFIVILTAGISLATAPAQQQHDTESVKPIELVVGDLTATFIDNSAYGTVHKAGYNGISELVHKKQDSTIFVPFYAGFNLEHIFGGDKLDPLMEPRKHLMQLRRISKNEIQLYQSATPKSQVESWTNFKLVAPHYIDIEFRCVIRSKEFFRHGYAGLFWASYIDTPADKKIYFQSGNTGTSTPVWLGTFSPKHGRRCTHLAWTDDLKLFMADDFNVVLANDFSEHRYWRPFYYGLFHNMVFAYFFEVSHEQKIRFSQSPTGGGKTNPAWDFQFIIPDFETNREYMFRARLVYKEFRGQDDILEEYRTWINNK